MFCSPPHQLALTRLVQQSARSSRACVCSGVVEWQRPDAAVGTLGIAPCRGPVREDAAEFYAALRTYTCSCSLRHWRLLRRGLFASGTAYQWPGLVGSLGAVELSGIAPCRGPVRVDAAEFYVALRSSF